MNEHDQQLGAATSGRRETKHISGMTELVFCPWCSAKAIDVTVHGDPRRHYICARDPEHEWAEGEGPIQEEEPQAMELSEVAEAIAQHVAKKIEKPSLFKRFSRLFGK